MAGRDWFTDCTGFVTRHLCRIGSVLIPALVAVVLWYCNRIETKSDDMQTSLNQIELKVGILIDRQPTRLSPGTVARADEE